MCRTSGATNLARAVASAGGVQNMQDDFELRPRKSKVMAQTTWVAVHELAFVLRSSGPPRPLTLGQNITNGCKSRGPIIRSLQRHAGIRGRMK